MEEVLKRIDNKIDAVEESLENKINDVEAKLEKRIDDVEVKLEKRIDDVEAKLEKRIDDVEAKLENKINQEIQFLKVDLNQKYDDLRESIFYLENSLGGKLDTICDFIKMQMDKNKENNQNFSQFDEKIEMNELRILNHEDRIKFLEKKLNQAN